MYVQMTYSEEGMNKLQIQYTCRWKSESSFTSPRPIEYTSCVFTRDTALLIYNF